ncbi:hypothetical protein HX810_09840 [Pseudomonas salomonii]|uniref:Uncharacterized protein n=1 Tax=Pseudomonas salomonii TaxID=191391 RepID=A0A7Y8GBU3_9PSED|nr:hypothetical protein [Pseudomonas salomonii]NWF07964.1 hypothetical protein [Pseudomonas salomonii]
MRVALAIFGTLVFCISASLSFYLLWIGKFTGTEFIAFTVSFAVLSLAAGFAPEIQEVSIAGNVVKLKEVKAEALKAIESLNRSRIEMLRFFLSLGIKIEGTYYHMEPVDPRTYPFWSLMKLIREYGCIEELKADILFSARALSRAQLNNIYRRNHNPSLNTGEVLPDSLELAGAAFDEAGINAAASQFDPAPENYRAEIKEALTEYSRLRELILELEAA